MKYVSSNLTLKKTQKPKYKEGCSKALKASSSLPGFKKTLFNHVLVRQGGFEPRYNRRKHSIGHDLTLNQPLRKLNKMLPGFNLRRLRVCVAFSLRRCYGLKQNRQSPQSLNAALLEASLPTKMFVSLVESHNLNLKTRNMFFKTLRHAAQNLNHSKRKRQTLSLVLQKSRSHPVTRMETPKYVWAELGSVLWHV